MNAVRSTVSAVHDVCLPFCIHRTQLNWNASGHDMQLLTHRICKHNAWMQRAGRARRAEDIKASSVELEGERPSSAESTQTGETRGASGGPTVISPALLPVLQLTALIAASHNSYRCARYLRIQSCNAVQHQVEGHACCCKGCGALV